MGDSGSQPRFRAHPGAGLSAADVSMLVAKLTTERRELSDRIEALARATLARDDCTVTDAIDAASNQESRLRAAGIADQLRARLEEIDAAFLRLETGRYGIDAASDEAIGLERLRLVPWAKASGRTPT